MNAFVDGDNFFQTVYIFYIYSDLQALAAIVFVLFTDWLASVKAYYFFRNMNLLKELMVELESKEFQPNQAPKNSGPADAKTVDVCLQNVLVLCREHFTSVGSVSRNGWVVSSVPAAILCLVPVRYHKLSVLRNHVFLPSVQCLFPRHYQSKRGHCNRCSDGVCNVAV
jgi:hypothetical protein